MNTIRLETSGSLGILTLANPPLNLFSAGVNGLLAYGPRGFRDKVVFRGR
jgi:hypothetical protein